MFHIHDIQLKYQYYIKYKQLLKTTTKSIKSNENKNIEDNEVIYYSINIKLIKFRGKSKICIIPSFINLNNSTKKSKDVWSKIWRWNIIQKDCRSNQRIGKKCKFRSKWNRYIFIGNAKYLIKAMDTSHVALVAL